MADIRYAPGDVWTVVAREAAVMISRAASPEALADIHRGLREGGGLAAVVEGLTGEFGASFEAIPDFAAAFFEPRGVRIAVRGAAKAYIERPGGRTDVESGAGVTTWTERLVPDAVRIALTAAESAVVEAVLPLADGVVPASVVVLERDDAAAGPAPEPARTRIAEPPASGQARPTTAPVPSPAAPAVPPPPAAGGVPLDTLLPRDTTVIPEPDTESGSDTDSQPDAESDGLAGPQADGGPAPASDPEEPIIDAVPTAYDHLWGATVMRPVEAAAVRVADADEEDTDTDAAPAEPEAREPIAGVPPVSTDSGPVDVGDHDGRTISVAQLRAMRAAAGEDARDDDAAAPADSMPPLAPPRPAAPGRLRLSTGQLVALDRTVVVGRRPRSTRVAGTDLPHLVVVDSPQQDISRSHVEFRVEGDSILVTDLHTTNGTMLVREGAAPVRLHPGEPTVTVPGDLIDLGDGISLVVENLT